MLLCLEMFQKNKLRGCRSYMVDGFGPYSFKINHYPTLLKLTIIQSTPLVTLNLFNFIHIPYPLNQPICHFHTYWAYELDLERSMHLVRPLVNKRTSEFQQFFIARKIKSNTGLYLIHFVFFLSFPYHMGSFFIDGAEYNAGLGMW